MWEKPLKGSLSQERGSLWPPPGPYLGKGSLTSLLGAPNFVPIQNFSRSLSSTLLNINQRIRFSPEEGTVPQERRTAGDTAVLLWGGNFRTRKWNIKLLGKNSSEKPRERSFSQGQTMSLSFWLSQGNRKT
jgi:hypothetical protein